MPGKTAFLIIITLSLRTSLFAQTSLGVEGGLSYNTYHTNIVNRAATSLAGGSGGNAAVVIRNRIHSWLYFIAAPGLVQKGYSMNRTDSLSGEYDQHTNTYLQLPIGISLAHSLGRLRIGIDAGLYAGYWLYGRVKGNTADVFGSVGNNNTQQFPLSAYDAGYSFDSRRDNRWEDGWWLGPEALFRLSNAWWLTAGARYFEAMTSAVKAPTNLIPAYNRTWVFTIGTTLAIPHPKSHRL
jgi:hypothetical protein